MNQLWYYGHRYGGSLKNLARACQRFEALSTRWETLYPDRILWAPWFAMAEAGVREDVAWSVIFEAIDASDGVVLDLDGAPMSPGMRDEEVQASGDIPVVKVDGEDFADVESEEGK